MEELLLSMLHKEPYQIQVLQTFNINVLIYTKEKMRYRHGTLSMASTLPQLIMFVIE